MAQTLLIQGGVLMPDATYKFHGDIKSGSVDVTVPVRLQDGAGEPQTGKEASDLTIRYWRTGGSVTTITPSDLSTLTSAHSDGGLKEVDATNMPGLYRLDLPDAAVATGAPWVVISILDADSVMFFERFNLEPNGSQENAATLVTLIATLEGVHVNGAVQDASPTSSGFKAAAGLSSVDNFYEKMLLVFVDGANASIPRPIGSYTGSTRTFSFSTPFPATPADGDSFILIGRIE
jgi:hypothetical protein